MRLEAAPATLRRRIIEREPAGWSGLHDLVAATGHMAPVIARLDGVALTLSTEGQQPEAVAARVREAFADRLSPAPRGAGP